MFSRDLSRQVQAAVAKYEAPEAAVFEAEVRRDYADQQADWMLTTAGKGFVYQSLRDTQRMAAGDPLIGRELLAFDEDLAARRRMALNLRFLRHR